MLGCFNKIYKMYLNPDIINRLKNKNTRILAVTKYLGRKETQQILPILKENKSIIGLGENRLLSLQLKNLPQQDTHYIGQLQSNKLKEISKYCSIIHSITKLKHVYILNELIDPPQIFIQINISREIQKSGVLLSEFPEFLSQVQKCLNIQILGISAIGAREFTVSEKITEFKELKKIRNKYCPDKLISAGTSCDFDIAIAENIDIIRIGTKLFL